MISKKNLYDLYSETIINHLIKNSTCSEIKDNEGAKSQIEWIPTTIFNKYKLFSIIVHDSKVSYKFNIYHNK